MTNIINRLVLQLALEAAFGAGQLLLGMVATHASLINVSLHLQPNVSAATAPLPPVGAGWG